MYGQSNYSVVYYKSGAHFGDILIVFNYFNSAKAFTCRLHKWLAISIKLSGILITKYYFLEVSENGNNCGDFSFGAILYFCR